MKQQTPGVECALQGIRQHQENTVECVDHPSWGALAVTGSRGCAACSELAIYLVSPEHILTLHNQPVVVARFLTNCGAQRLRNMVPAVLALTDQLEEH